MYPMINNPEEVLSLSRALIALMICHVIFMLTFFVAGMNALLLAIMEMMCAWILLMTWCVFSYCLLAIYIFIVGINAITVFVYAGLHMQHDKLDGWNKFRFIVYVLAFLFYMFAIYIASKAYREFKFRTVSFDANNPEVQPNNSQVLPVNQARFPGAPVRLQ